MKLVITEPGKRTRCAHCYNNGNLRAEFTMNNGQSFTQEVCWSCVRKIYQNLNIIQSFFQPTLAKVLEKNVGFDENVAF